MAINTTLQTIKLDYEQILNSKQIVVQCNLDTTSKGGVARICQAQSQVIVDNTQVLTGQLKVQGKVFIKVLFFNTDNQPQSFDYIADFVETLACKEVTEEMQVFVNARTLDTENSVSGNQIKIQCVVELTPRILESVSNDFVVDVEDALTQKQVQLTQEYLYTVQDSMVISDEVDSGMCIDEILLFDCKAIICEQECSKGRLILSGICNVDFVYTSEGNLYNQTMKVPFVRDCGDCDNFTKACIKVSVKDSKLIITGTESQNILKAEITLEFCGNVFECGEVEVVTDVFCPTQDIQLNSKSVDFDMIVGSKKIEEVINGSVESDEKDCVIKKVCECVVLNCGVENVFCEDGILMCEGLVVAGIIYEDDKNSMKCMQIELPYSLQNKCEDCMPNSIFSGDCLVCDMSTKIKRGREVEISASILINICEKMPSTFSGVNEIQEGEIIEQKNCAISIFMPQSGQTLWDVAKCLGVSIDKIKEQNPDISEIMSGQERLLIYREISN